MIVLRARQSSTAVVVAGQARLLLALALNILFVVVLRKNGRRIRQEDSGAMVVLTTGFPTTSAVIESMKLGAYDYVSKPFMSDEILLTLRKAAERERLRTENAFLRREIEKTARPEEILYASGPMEEVVRTAGKVKDYDATVLVNLQGTIE